MDKLYFDGSPEPDNFRFDFEEAVSRIAEKKGITKLIINFSDKDDYYNTLNLMRRFDDERISITSTSREDDTTIIVENAMDLDEEKTKKNKA